MLSRLSYIFSMMRTDPLGGVIYLLSFTVAILASLILHEVSHGFMAYRCGDPTAKMFGRLSLNPLKHLDPMGTVFMVLFGFGWAKPVPVNPRNFRDYRRDDFMVSIAGIITNLTLFVISTLILAWMGSIRFKHGSTELQIAQYVYNFLYMLSSINLSLAIFNLLPIPPLDGYHLFNDLLFKGRIRLTGQQFRIAQMALMVVCLSGILGRFLSGAHSAVFDAVYNLFARLF